MDHQAFFTVHADLPREGPGLETDVAWALERAALPRGARVVDAGCGPGADIVALRRVPGATVLGVDTHAGFVAQARARYRDDPRVRLEQADMATLADHTEAPFDMIWCAGALYFLGLEAGLRTLSGALKKGGVLAFSEPCFFAKAPSDAARVFWEGYPTRTRPEIIKAVRAAGYDFVASRALPDASWEAYYIPLEERIAALRPTADAALTTMLDFCADEAAIWRRVRAETGYMQVVARWRG